MIGRPRPIQPFEKWLCASMLIWPAAWAWMLGEVRAAGPFASTFDLVVGLVLTAAALTTGLIALILSRRRP